ncbi:MULTISPECIES: RHS repeat domain-containing protein [unclassified Pseudomonas]|uniref:RHS repeat domain-containing protein n=1 Tax=unclassified Pseudomonas TaxID=196821 RepID=UPI001B32C5BB|nr:MULTISPECIES: RHS repeat-associated core domain-containing protein [unclassified Pseudomonas]
MSVHSRTPALSANDPRGLPVRTVDYWRTEVVEPVQTRVNRTRHDVAGRAVAQWDPRLWALQISDPQTPANLTSVYSLNGQVLRSDSVDAGIQIALHGGGGQVLFDWDSRGTRREIQHDPLLRPLAVFEEGESQPRLCVERFMYGEPDTADPTRNQLGQLIRHDDPAGSVLFETFAFSGQCSENTRHFTLDSVTPDWPEPIDQRARLLEPGEGATTQWRFGPQGQVIEQVDARGNRQGSDFTLDGRLRASHLQLKHQSEAQVLVSDIRYNADGQVTQELAGNGVRTTLTYRPEDGRLLERQAKKGSGEDLQLLRYEYDRIGNVLSIEDKALPIRYFANQRIDPVSRFTYDSLYQLSEATGWEAGAASQGPESLDRNDPAALSNYRQSYRYDESGNLLELTHVGARSGRKLKAARFSNRCLPFRDDVPPTEEEIAATFDSRGNLRALEAGRSLTWNLRNQLQLVTPVERASGLNDLEQYVYDGDEQRVRKTRSSQTNARGIVDEVRYLPGLELRDDTATGRQLHVIIAGGGLNSVRVLHWDSAPPTGSNDHYRYTITDHLGSTSLELGEDARIISQESFYPFGETAWSKDSEVSYKTIRYSGKERDATGLYYYGCRYYMPWLQRWLNPDPAEAIDGLNLFRMVVNNPVSLIDENGLVATSNLTGVGSSRTNGPSSARPPIPPRPNAFPTPGRPQVPPRPTAFPTPIRSAMPIPPIKNMSAEMENVTPRPPNPQVDVGRSTQTSGPLPSYASSRRMIGHHELMISSTGAVIVMRSDNRSPDDIRSAGGFFPKEPRKDYKQIFRNDVTKQGWNGHARTHVGFSNPRYVSTGIDDQSGGYAGQRRYLYRMEIPGLEERAINDSTLGLAAPMSFNPNRRMDTRLLMSATTVEESDFVAMIPGTTSEMTFINPIPSAFIVSYSEGGTGSWKPFH